MKKTNVFLGAALAGILLVPAISLAVTFFYVDDAGNVGIGNSAPAHKLDVSGAIYSRLYTLTDGATVSVNWNNGNVQSVTLGGNRTLTFSNGQSGAGYRLLLNQDSTGGRTVTWPTSVKWTNGASPALTTTASGTDVIEFLFDGTNYLASHKLDFRTAIPIDNFNAYANGSLSSNNGGSGWNGTWSSSSNYNVQDSVVYEGARAVSNTSNTSGNIYRNFNTATSATFAVAMRRSTNFTGKTRTLVESTAGATQYAVELASTGQIVLKSTAGDVNIQSYATSTWYRIEMQVDATVPQFRARVDGGSWTAWKAPFDGSSTNGVDRLYFDQDIHTANNYWDDLR